MSTCIQECDANLKRTFLPSSQLHQCHDDNLPYHCFKPSLQQEDGHSMQQKRYNHSHDQFDYVSTKNDNFSCSNEKKIVAHFVVDLTIMFRDAG